MKTKFLLALAALFVLAASTSAEEKLSESVAAEVSVLNDARELEYYDAEQLALDLTQKYIEALTNTKNSAQKAGKLETLMAAENEIKRVNSGTEDGNAPQDNEVLRLKTAYTNVMATRRLEIDQKKAEAGRRHAAQIDLIVANLTKQGKIDEAKLVLANKKPITKVSPPAEKAEEASANLAKGKPYSFSVATEPRFPDDGGNQLTNGLTMESTEGNAVDSTVGWFKVEQVEVIIDLGKSANLSRFRAFVGGNGPPSGPGSSVHAPEAMSVFGSNSKEQWTPIASLDKIDNVNGWIEVKGTGNYRYVKWQFVRSPKFNWLMVSELEVY